MAELISEDYRRMNAALHRDADRYGRSGVRWAGEVAELLRTLGAASMLDYGAGKGTLVATLRPDFPAVDFREYDPAVEAISAAPEPADLVTCTDVLEHVEPDRLDAVLDDLRAKTRIGVFLTVATRPAAKTLADGRNAHLIQEHYSWWLPRIWARWELVRFSSTPGEFACLGLAERHARTGRPPVAPAPPSAEAPAARQDGWRRITRSVRLVLAERGPMLSDGRRGVPVPPDLVDAVAWVLDRDAFDARDLAAAFPRLDGEAKSRLLRDLAAMRIIGPR
jgi:hypothetical protein